MAKKRPQKSGDWLKDIAKKGQFEAFGGADKSQIETAQHLLGLKFPESYIAFLETYGCCDFECDMITGICQSDAPEEREIFDVVQVTEKAWNDKYPRLFLPVPRDSIVLNHYAGGGFHMLACSTHIRPGSVT